MDLKWIIIFLFLVPFTIAEKVCTDNYCNDVVIGKPSFEEETDNYRNIVVMNPGTDEDKKGHLFTEIGAIISVITGGGAHGVSTVYYDLEVDVRKLWYGKYDIIEADVTIINKGYEPDRDGSLLTYLVGPDGTRYLEKKKEFELIPPTCPNGTYDRYEDVCVYQGKKLEPKKYIETIKMAFPQNAQVGEWKVYAEYESRVQPKIIAWDSFALITGNITLLMISGGILLFAFRKRKEKNKND